jgi:hypothetical protein
VNQIGEYLGNTPLIRYIRRQGIVYIVDQLVLIGQNL